jgi:hypothetical protein
MYSYGRSKFYSLLNKPLHKFLALTPAMILKMFFYKVNTFLLLDELPQKTIPHFITK